MSDPVTHRGETKRVRPTREEQIGGRCKHFTGVSNKCCKAGVRYVDVERRHSPMNYDSGGVTYSSSLSRPCITKYNHAGAECDKLEFPTAEEIAAIMERQEKGLLGIMKARAAIVEKIGPYVKRKSPDVAGSLACPVCTTGTLGYRRATFNGHIHARCSTEGCVAWME